MLTRLTSRVSCVWREAVARRHAGGDHRLILSALRPTPRTAGATSAVQSPGAPFDPEHRPAGGGLGPAWPGGAAGSRCSGWPWRHFVTGTESVSDGPPIWFRHRLTVGSATPSVRLTSAMLLLSPSLRPVHRLIWSLALQLGGIEQWGPVDPTQRSSAMCPGGAGRWTTLAPPPGTDTPRPGSTGGS